LRERAFLRGQSCRLPWQSLPHRPDPCSFHVKPVPRHLVAAQGYFLLRETWEPGLFHVKPGQPLPLGSSRPRPSRRSRPSLPDVFHVERSRSNSLVPDLPLSLGWVPVPPLSVDATGAPMQWGPAEQGVGWGRRAAGQVHHGRSQWVALANCHRTRWPRSPLAGQRMCSNPDRETSHQAAHRRD
jgi:hypothetical protein